MYRPYLQMIDKETRVLEIGPLEAPMAARDDGFTNVFYTDIRSTDELKRFYAKDANVDCDKIVGIDFVLRENYAETFHDVPKFDYVLASHVIEHMPQLLFSLRDIAEVLVDGGRLCLTIPDKRYCFDHYRFPTSFAQAYDIYHRGITNNPMAVLDFVSNAHGTGMNDPVHWRLNPCDYSFMLANPQIASCEETYLQAMSGKYIDVHFTVFTPESFLVMMFYATALGLSPYECEHFWPTDLNTLEFNVVLKRIARDTTDDEDSKQIRLTRIINLLGSIEDDTLQLEVVKEKYRFVERDAYDDIVTQRDALDIRRQELEQREAAYLASTSWKVTRPLRSVGRIVKNIREKRGL